MLEIFSPLLTIRTPNRMHFQICVDYLSDLIPRCRGGWTDDTEPGAEQSISNCKRFIDFTTSFVSSKYVCAYACLSFNAFMCKYMLLHLYFTCTFGLMMITCADGSRTRGRYVMVLMLVGEMMLPVLVGAVAVMWIK